MLQRRASHNGTLYKSNFFYLFYKQTWTLFDWPTFSFCKVESCTQLANKMLQVHNTSFFLLQRLQVRLQRHITVAGQVLNSKHTHTHTPIRMFRHFRVNQRCRRFISKFSRSYLWCTCSQLTPGGTCRPTQTLYLHESRQNKPKSEVCKTAMSPFDIRVASSSVILMIHAASWHETCILYIKLYDVCAR